MKSVTKGRTVRMLSQQGRIARSIAAVAIAALLTTACGDSSGPRTVASVVITPTTTTLPVGGTQQFTVVITDSEGDVLSANNRPAWSVVAGGGTITQTGLFTAGTTAGTFTNTVVVTCSGVSASATVIVTAGPLATITVTPNPGTMPINGTQQYTAVGRDANNNVVAITPVWSVTAGGGTINASSGLFTAGTVTGTFANTVRATSGTIFGTATAIVTAGPLATITVTPDPATMPTGGTQQFTAVGRDAGGNVVPMTPVWSVVNGGGTINASTGLFTAGLVTGTFNNTVVATSGTLSDNATVIVTGGAPPPTINLGTASTYGILAGSTVTCASAPGTVNADVGVSPGSALTGFPPCVITGSTHLADAVAATAQNDLTTAYNQVAGLPCGTVVGTVNIGGTTRAAGVYCSATSMLVTGDLTLDGGGDPNAVFVFQAGSTLTTAGNVVLINGAQAQNVYWQVGSSATIGGGPATWQGNILALTTITLNNNVTLIGRALARNGAVTMGTGNTITLP